MANISGMASDAEIEEAYEDYAQLLDSYRNCDCWECMFDQRAYEAYYVELFLKTGRMIDEKSTPARREPPPVRALFAKNARN